MKINNLDYKFICDLIYFEGSILSLFQREEQCYLFSWFDCDNSSNSWAIVDLSKNDLRGYLNKKITLRNIFENSEKIIIFSKSKDEIKIEKIISFNELPLDTIPSDDSFLDYDFSTPEAEKLTKGETVNSFNFSDLEVKSNFLLPDSVTLKFDDSDNNAMVKLFGNNYEMERSFIENTVKNPDREEHFKPLSVNYSDENYDSSLLVSLFAKYYPNEKRKSDSFMMLVIGKRNLSVLSVNFAIRIYDSALMKSKSLIGALRGFAKKFGSKISINGKEDFFFYDKQKPNTKKNIEMNTPNSVLFHFENTIQDTIFYIVFAIDIKKYRKSLRQHHFKFLPT